MKHPRFSIHPFAAAGLFLLLFSMPATTSFAALSSVLLHESGHMTAALLCRRHITKITLMPVGINMEFTAPASYREELLIAAAGPVMNLLYTGAAILWMAPAGANAVATFSMTLAILNFLPIRTLDGGRIAEALLSLCFGERTAERVMYGMTCVCLSVMWVLSLYVFFYSGVNFTLLLFCAYLFAYLIVKKV